MDLPAVTTAASGELDPVVHTLTLAFSTDPVMRWMLPSPQHYLDHWPELITTYCGDAVGEGTAFRTADFSGAALWRAPGKGPDEERMGAFIAAHIRPEIHEDFMGLLAEMDRYHPHEEPCWYLAAIGVDPARQGEGLGSVLMKHANRLLDDARVLGYLESSNPANITLYQRHGFEIMGEIRSGTAPVVTPMIRYPQTR